MKLNPAFVRIGLRYVSGALVTYGLVSADTAATIQNDPVIVSVVGIALGAATETLYGLAKRWGWRT